VRLLTILPGNRYFWVEDMKNAFSKA